MTSHLLYELDANGIVWLTFNRPTLRNATSIEMIEALHASLLRIEANKAIRCVVLSGAGGHFMSGADLSALEEMASLSPPERRVAMQERLAKSAPIFSLIQSLEQPVLASVSGTVAGGGMGLMLACDLIIAAADSKFALSQVHVGLSPDGGSSWHLPRAIGMKRAKQLALLGETIAAPTALAWGLVNWVVAPEAVHDKTMQIARQLALGAARSQERAKYLLNASLGVGLAEQVALESQSIGMCAETEDFVEGLRAVRAKSRPTFSKQRA
ncbi:enoyl-CoA hydratase/isomerase family protein [Alcaligenaceae bacterium]|nr:enoyl-CoA hydratase/isomerase family protein [Alcaligenaceae bacterium]